MYLRCSERRSQPSPGSGNDTPGNLPSPPSPGSEKRTPGNLSLPSPGSEKNTPRNSSSLSFHAKNAANMFSPDEVFIDPDEFFALEEFAHFKDNDSTFPLIPAETSFRTPQKLPKLQPLEGLTPLANSIYPCATPAFDSLPVTPVDQF